MKTFPQAEETASGEGQSPIIMICLDLKLAELADIRYQARRGEGTNMEDGVLYYLFTWGGVG
jgi:hypothetical protein